MAAEKRKSILLIDDDVIVLQTIASLLKKFGYIVRAFRNSSEAIQEAMMEDYDLIITDIRMPGIDGFQTIRYIREIRQKHGKDTAPEILITGYANDHGKEVEKIKPRAIIHKPFDLNEFMEVVNRAMGEEMVSLVNRRASH